MRKFIFLIITAMGLGTISCSHNHQKNDETAQINEEDFVCLCCLEKMAEDSIVCDTLQ